MSKSGRIIIQLIGLAGILILAFYLARLASGNEAIQSIVSEYGYAGIFVVALVSGFNLLVPVPAASFIPLFLESGLLFLPTVLIISLGMTIADGIAYALAHAGKRIATHSFGEGLFQRFHSFREKYRRYPLAILFIFAAVAPLPNEVLVVPAAFMGYSFKRMAPVLFAGNLVFNILFARGLLNIFNSL